MEAKLTAIDHPPEITTERRRNTAAETTSPSLRLSVSGPRFGGPSSAVGRLDIVVATFIGLTAFGVYVLTLAPTVLRSDSGEFHVVPWVLGIAHPPGYPLLTLLGRLAMFLPAGDAAYRLNLLDAGAAAAAVGLVYLVVVELVAGKAQGASQKPAWHARTGGLAAAASLGLGATYWQQSVVGGPRPLGFFFTALLLWLVFCWGNQPTIKNSVLLAGAAGLALTHHPNQALMFPGLLIYLGGRSLLGRAGPAATPVSRLAGWRKLRSYLLPLLAFLVPLLLYLYLPLRSAMGPALGALDLTNPRELLLYVTARHYQNDVFDNCDGSLLLQAQRYLVFLTLQFGPILAPLIAAGAAVSLAHSPLAGIVLLYAFASNAIFGICSTLAMPDYIVPSYIVAAIWLGLGLSWVISWSPLRWPSFRPAVAAATTLVVLGFSAFRLASGLPYQSMANRTFDAERASAGMAQIQPRAQVLSDWESITPVWYAQHLLGLGQTAGTAVVTAPPASDRWLIEVEQNFRNGAVTLAERVPALDGRYRLFPIGPMYDVTERLVFERADAGGILSEQRALRLMSYRIDRPVAAPGDVVSFTLYQKSDEGSKESYVPVVRLGGERPVEFAFNSHMRYALPTWADDEVVGEVYELSVPTWAPPGQLPLDLAYRVESREGLVGLSGGRPWTRIGTLEVTPPRNDSLAPPHGIVANFGNQLVLQGGKSGSGSMWHELGYPSTDLRLKAGDTLETEVRWSALRWIDESYTLFAHLLDGQNQLVAQEDALPLGGVYHTYKWVPGQTITDWSRLRLPSDLPTGEYWVEIGAYQSTTTRRLLVVNPQGGSDRTTFRFGPIRVE